MIGFIEKTIRDAGKTLLQSSRNVLKEKEGGGNFVLKADIASEQHILTAIQKAFPTHRILSEESHSQITHPEKEEHLWIVDPLDGTTNARFNIPFFAISIAYMEYGEVIAGGIFDPNRSEFFSAQKGKGAQCNNKKISVSDSIDPQGSIVAIGSPYKEHNFDLTYPKGRIIHQQDARIVNFGSSVLQCAWVGCGRLGAYFEAGLKPWDIAAAHLIVSESGGKMIDPYNTARPFSLFTQQAVLVGGGNIVDKLKELIKK